MLGGGGWEPLTQARLSRRTPLLPDSSALHTELSPPVLPSFSNLIMLTEKREMAVAARERERNEEMEEKQPEMEERSS